MHVIVDDRLVHGEIVTAWSKSIPVVTLLVIDDYAEKDEFRKTILKLLIPKCSILVLIK